MQDVQSYKACVSKVSTTAKQHGGPPPPTRPQRSPREIALSDLLSAHRAHTVDSADAPIPSVDFIPPMQSPPKSKPYYFANLFPDRPKVLLCFSSR
jgi:hypothetical protein